MVTPLPVCSGLALSLTGVGMTANLFGAWSCSWFSDVIELFVGLDCRTLHMTWPWTNNCRGGPPRPPLFRESRRGGHGGPPLQLFVRSMTQAERVGPNQRFLPVSFCLIRSRASAESAGPESEVKSEDSVAFARAASRMVCKCSTYHWHHAQIHKCSLISMRSRIVSGRSIDSEIFSTVCRQAGNRRNSQ